MVVILLAKREQDKAAWAASILSYFAQMGVFIRDVRHTSYKTKGTREIPHMITTAP